MIVKGLIIKGLTVKGLIVKLPRYRNLIIFGLVMPIERIINRLNGLILLKLNYKNHKLILHSKDCL